jgi:hypothetical protein
MPKMRLDFIFASRPLLEGPRLARAAAKKSRGRPESGERGGGAVNRLVAAGIQRSNLTEELSDHFPVYLAWEDDSRPFP